MRESEGEAAAIRPMKAKARRKCERVIRRRMHSDSAFPAPGVPYPPQRQSEPTQTDSTAKDAKPREGLRFSAPSGH